MTASQSIVYVLAGGGAIKIGVSADAASGLQVRIRDIACVTGIRKWEPIATSGLTSREQAGVAEALLWLHARDFVLLTDDGRPTEYFRPPQRILSAACRLVEAAGREWHEFSRHPVLRSAIDEKDTGLASIPAAVLAAMFVNLPCPLCRGFHKRTTECQRAQGWAC